MSFGNQKRKFEQGSDDLQWQYHGIAHSSVQVELCDWTVVWIITSPVVRLYLPWISGKGLRRPGNRIIFFPWGFCAWCLCINIIIIKSIQKKINFWPFIINMVAKSNEKEIQITICVKDLITNSLSCIFIIRLW